MVYVGELDLIEFDIVLWEICNTNLSVSSLYSPLCSFTQFRITSKVSEQEVRIAAAEVNIISQFPEVVMVTATLAAHWEQQAHGSWRSEMSNGNRRCAGRNPTQHKVNCRLCVCVFSLNYVTELSSFVSLLQINNFVKLYFQHFKDVHVVGLLHLSIMLGSCDLFHFPKRASRDTQVTRQL